MEPSYDSRRGVHEPAFVPRGRHRPMIVAIDWSTYGMKVAYNTTVVYQVV